MNRLIQRWPFLKDYGLVVTALAVVLALYWTLAPRTVLPDTAPPFKLELADGGMLDSESLRGRVVVLNFWATWCSPCREEIPQIAAFAASHPEVHVVGISMDDMTVETLAPQARRLGVTWPLVVADSPTRQAWGVQTLPTTVVLGPDGRVWRSWVGTLTARDLERLVQSGPPPEKDPSNQAS